MGLLLTAAAFRMALAVASVARAHDEIDPIDLFPEEADAEMLVVDVRGRLVRRISSGRFPAGLHRLAWDGRDGGGRAVASGVYFCRLRVADRTFERRIVMIR